MVLVVNCVSDICPEGPAGCSLHCCAVSITGTELFPVNVCNHVHCILARMYIDASPVVEHGSI